MNSKTELKNSENVVSSLNTKKSKEPNTLPMFKSLDGREYTKHDMALLASHRVTEILLYNILLKLSEKALDKC